LGSTGGAVSTLSVRLLKSERGHCRTPIKPKQITVPAKASMENGEEEEERDEKTLTAITPECPVELDYYLIPCSLGDGG
jgi:hypothetical protein